jgi:hypothetical protein
MLINIYDYIQEKILKIWLILLKIRQICNAIIDGLKIFKSLWGLEKGAVFRSEKLIFGISA